jgi:hypothetical protein
MLLGCVLIAACSPSGPVRRFTKGEELVFNEFSEPNTFERGGFEGARLQVADGVYRITVTEGDSTFWWGQWGEVYDNVVIDVDANLLSERPENIYGVMCRVRGEVGLDLTPDPELQAIMTLAPQAAESGLLDIGEATEEATAEAETTETVDEEATAEAVEDDATQEAADETATEVASDEATEEAGEDEATAEAADDEATEEATAPVPSGDAGQAVINGDGYLFLVRGDGSYAIMRARGRDVQALVNWGQSGAINPGPVQNHIRAVCVNDYLAMYVNDQFVADAIDDTYPRGLVGLAAAAVDRLGVQVEFDNLSISQATAE